MGMHVDVLLASTEVVDATVVVAVIAAVGAEVCLYLDGQTERITAAI